MSQTPKAAWIFSLAFFPLGLGGFVLGSGDLYQSIRSRDWPRVEGVILSARLEKKFLAPDQADIRYEFAVEGQSYVSTHIWPGNNIANMPLLMRSRSQRLLDAFPEGKKVLVSFNPKHPWESALIPGPHHVAKWMGMFTFFLFLGIWSPLALIRFPKKNLNPL